MVGQLLKTLVAKILSFSFPFLIGGYVLSIPLRYFFGCRIVGLTGSIASGKSTCMKRVLREFGGHIDMDVIGKLVQIPGFKGWANLRKTFGFQFFKPDGMVDSESLGRHIFGNRTERNKLNAALRWPILEWMAWDLMSWFLWHIYVRKTTGRAIEPCRVVYLDAALLFETSLNYLCDTTLLIDVTKETQVKRLMGRDHISETYAQQKIGSQQSNEWKKSKASLVISNDGVFDTETAPLLTDFAKKQNLQAGSEFVQCLWPTRFSLVSGILICGAGYLVFMYFSVMFNILSLLGSGVKLLVI